MVSRMLMKKSAPQPRSRKTPSGGRTMARMILMMSLFCCQHRRARKARRDGGAYDPVKGMVAVV